MAATHSARSMSLASFRAGHAVCVDAERAERGGREPAARNLRRAYPIDATARPELPTARAHAPSMGDCLGWKSLEEEVVLTPSREYGRETVDDVRQLLVQPRRVCGLAAAGLDVQHDPGAE